GRASTPARRRRSTSGEIPASQDERSAPRTAPAPPMSLSVRDGMGDIREEAPAGTSRAGAASASQRAPIREKAPAAVHPYSRVVDPLLKRLQGASVRLRTLPGDPPMKTV